MSISGVGAFGTDPGQLLSRMLSRLDPISTTNSGTTSNSNTASIPAGSSTAPDADTALIGTGQAGLSDQIMAMLVQLQQQPTQTATITVPGATQAVTTSDPVQQLFSAMDSDGSGTVSESEMESYIEGKGGTQAQADALFSALSQNANGQNTSGGITEQQLAAGVSQAQHSGHHHHHHHGGGGTGSSGSNSSSDVTSQILGALDTNQDGSISADEFATAFSSSVAANSANPSDSSTLFSQIDSNGDGAISSQEIGTFLTSLAQQTQSNLNILGTFGQLAMQSYSANVDNTVGITQSVFA